MKRFTTKRLYGQQDGLAAFIVVATLMIVISLVVLSFARIVRNEQRQTLDRNLSSRAFYAAESGVNMAAKALDSNKYDAATGKPDCTKDPAATVFNYPADYKLDAAANTEVTCLTIDEEPGTLEYPIGAGTTRVVPINASGDIGDLQFSWQKNGAITSYAGCTGPAGTFKTIAAWNSPVAPVGCQTPLLRIDIVPTTSISHASLTDPSTGVATFFLYPMASGVPNDTPVVALLSGRGNNQGYIHSASCNLGNTTMPKDCNAAISIPAAEGQKFYARISSFYADAKVTIKSSDSSVVFSGAQMVIDSTGRAQDIIRRIQVRRPIGSDEGVPAYAIEAADGLCKRLLVIPGVGASIDTSVPAAERTPGSGICSP